MANIQVRDVPDDVHRRLKAQAGAAGQSLNEYLLRRFAELAEMPTWPEMTERIKQRGRVRDLPRASELVRRDRDSR